MFKQKDLIYHRGRHGYVEQDGHFVLIAENSLLAFRAAIDDGATMIEFDARKNPRGTTYDPIIAHDNVAHEKVPTIVGALDVIQARCAVNIEIKDPEIWRGLMSLVTWYITYDGWRFEQFVISTFHHKTAVDIKKRFPQFRVGVIMDAIPLLPYVTMLQRNGRQPTHAAQECRHGHAKWLCVHDACEKTRYARLGLDSERPCDRATSL